MAENGELRTIWGKHKAITTLIPYAAWQERDGQPEMLDALINAARASGLLGFLWHRPTRFANILPSNSTPRGIIVASPHFRWNLLAERGDLVQQWVAAVSATPYTEEVAQSIVDALLRISFRTELWPHITLNVWSWLKKRPCLPPDCTGRQFGTYANNVQAVRQFEDPELFKSYLALVWSEWYSLWDSGFDEMCASIPEDFGGIGMGHHRADLIQRLDYVLGRLDLGIDYLKQHNPGVDGFRFKKMKEQYRNLKDILLEMNIEAITRASYPVIPLLCILILAGSHRIPHDIYVQPSSPIPVVSHPEPSIPLIPSPRFAHTRISTLITILYMPAALPPPSTNEVRSVSPVPQMSHRWESTYPALEYHCRPIPLTP